MKLFSAGFKFGYEVGLGFWCSLLVTIGMFYAGKKIIFWAIAKWFTTKGLPV